MSEDAATAFLLERTQAARRKKDNDETGARQVAQKLGCLALALEQAGAYISARKATLDQYLRDWEAQHQQVLEWKNERLMKYPNSVAVTWKTTVDQLSQAARLLLDRLAWLAPEPVPESLLNVHLPEEESLDWFAALTEISDYSLVERSDDLPEFNVHRLVQDVTRTKQEKKLADKNIAICLQWIDESFIGQPSDVRNWPVLEPLVPHVQALLAHADGQKDNVMVISNLFNQLGLFYFTKAQYGEDEPLMRRALEIGEQSFGKNHPNVAIRLNNLAQLLQDTNRLSEAEPLMRRALKIEEQSFGENHPNVAIALNNLAQLLKSTNRLSEAEPLMRRALEIDKQSFGENHPNFARDLNNLARLFQDTNRLSEAEPLMRRALQIAEQGFGENHPKVAITLNNLAQLLKDTKRLSEAEPLMKQSYSILLVSLGTDHPNTKNIGNNYISLLLDMGKTDEQIKNILSNLLN